MQDRTTYLWSDSYLIDKPTLKRLIQKMTTTLSEQAVSAVEQSADFKAISDQLNKVRDIERRLMRYAYIIRLEKKVVF